jgi:prevent-host-death family protein
MESHWTLQDAKNKFSEVVNVALKGTPQVVTKRGVPAVIVLAVEQYESMLTKERSDNAFINHLLSMPNDHDVKTDEDSVNLQLREVEF